MALINSLITGTVLLFLWQLFSLVRNYLVARRLGLPIRLSPVSWQNSLWIPLAPLFAPLRHLPFGLGEWTQYSQLGWTHADRYYTHERLGPAFAIVSPSRTELIISDPAACEKVITNWRKWTKPAKLYDIIKTFGPNVDTENGEEWQRHRRIIAYGFKEANNRLVWTEGVKQGSGLASSWLKRISAKASPVEIVMADVAKDAGAVAMHVLAGAGFGKSYDFEEGLEMPEPGHQMSYAEAIRILFSNLLMMMVLKGVEKLPRWILPGKVKELAIALVDFDKYMKEMVSEERASMKKGTQGTDTLGSMLIRANELEKSGVELEGTRRRALTDRELYGNLYVTLIAGQETTANALTYAFGFLAANPDVQNWVKEEINKVHGSGNEEYQECFPQLVRTLAVMYETVRLWGPQSSLIKDSGKTPQPLTIQGKEYMVPSHTYVTINFMPMHTSPEYWGEDSLEWRPQRWIKTDPTIGRESLAETPTSTYLFAWAYGPRVCPGKRFSQVEFTAVMFAVLREYSIKPSLRDSESESAAAARLTAVLDDSVFSLVAKIRRPNDAGIVLTRR